MDVIKIDLDYLRKDLTTEQVPKLIDFIGAYVQRAKAYTQIVKEDQAQGETPKGLIWMGGGVPHYESIRDAVTIASDRKDLTTEQSSKLETMATFLSQEQEIIKRYIFCSTGDE